MVAFYLHQAQVLLNLTGCLKALFRVLKSGRVMVLVGKKCEREWLACAILLNG